MRMWNGDGRYEKRVWNGDRGGMGMRMWNGDGWYGNEGMEWRQGWYMDVEWRQVV